jgi:NusA-like KH domain protein
MSTINMQTMRYINLLDKVTRVKTRKCFTYNNMVYFAVPRGLVSKAIGPEAINIKKLQEQLQKRVKIIAESSGFSDIKRFVSEIVTPIKFKNIELKEKCFVLTAGGTQNKAALFGRDKRRFEELRQIIEDTFGFDLKIV